MSLEVIPEDQIVIPENTSPSPSPDKTPLSSPGYSMLKSKSIVTLPSGTSPGGVAVSHKPFSTDPGTRRLSDPNKPDRKSQSPLPLPFFCIPGALLKGTTPCTNSFWNRRETLRLPKTLLTRLNENFPLYSLFFSFS